MVRLEFASTMPHVIPLFGPLGIVSFFGVVDFSFDYCTSSCLRTLVIWTVLDLHSQSCLHYSMWPTLFSALYPNIDAHDYLWHNINNRFPWLSCFQSLGESLYEQKMEGLVVCKLWSCIVDTPLQVYYRKKKQGKRVMDSKEVENQEEEVETSNQVQTSRGKKDWLVKSLWQLKT